MSASSMLIVRKTPNHEVTDKLVQDIIDLIAQLSLDDDVAHQDIEGDGNQDEVIDTAVHHRWKRHEYLFRARREPEPHSSCNRERKTDRDASENHYLILDEMQ